MSISEKNDSLKDLLLIEAVNTLEISDIKEITDEDWNNVAEQISNRIKLTNISSDTCKDRFQNYLKTENNDLSQIKEKLKSKRKSHLRLAKQRLDLLKKKITNEISELRRGKKESIENKEMQRAEDDQSLFKFLDSFQIVPNEKEDISSSFMDSSSQLISQQNGEGKEPKQKNESRHKIDISTGADRTAPSSLPSLSSTQSEISSLSRKKEKERPVDQDVSSKDTKEMKDTSNEEETTTVSNADENGIAISEDIHKKTSTANEPNSQYKEMEQTQHEDHGVEAEQENQPIISPSKEDKNEEQEQEELSKDTEKPIKKESEEQTNNQKLNIENEIESQEKEITSTSPKEVPMETDSSEEESDVKSPSSECKKGDQENSENFSQDEKEEKEKSQKGNDQSITTGQDTEESKPIVSYNETESEKTDVKIKSEENQEIQEEEELEEETLIEESKEKSKREPSVSEQSKEIEPTIQKDSNIKEETDEDGFSNVEKNDETEETKEEKSTQQETTSEKHVSTLQSTSKELEKSEKKDIKEQEKQQSETTTARKTSSKGLTRTKETEGAKPSAAEDKEESASFRDDSSYESLSDIDDADLTLMKPQDNSLPAAIKNGSKPISNQSSKDNVEKDSTSTDDITTRKELSSPTSQSDKGKKRTRDEMELEDEEQKQENQKHTQQTNEEKEEERGKDDSMDEKNDEEKENSQFSATDKQQEHGEPPSKKPKLETDEELKSEEHLDSPLQLVLSRKEEEQLRKQFTANVKEALRKINVHTRSSPFRFPVDSESAPHYDNLIRKKTDLSTIKSMIDSGKIITVIELWRSLLLMFQNAQTYNLPNSEVFMDSVELRKYARRVILEAFEKERLLFSALQGGPRRVLRSTRDRRK